MEPFPPSILNPNPAAVFSKVTVKMRSSDAALNEKSIRSKSGFAFRTVAFRLFELNSVVPQRPH